MELTERYRLQRLGAVSIVIVLLTVVTSLLAGTVHKNITETNVAIAEAAGKRADADRAMFEAMGKTAEQKTAGAK